MTVPFADYIANVASSEIYPTWPENAIRANVYAQVTFALNRIYTEWYRSRGYPFDITYSTSYDQKFIKNRNIFENVSEIVDDIFNRYVVKQGSQNPYFTEYCNGTTVTCSGLSQWGTVSLANQGKTPYEILQYYYGNDIDIKTAPILPYVESYPGEPLRPGSRDYEVRLIQQRLNRIARHFPAIPKINPVDGVVCYANNLAFYDVPMIHDVFDTKEYKKSKTKFYATVTNVKTGDAEYIELENR